MLEATKQYHSRGQQVLEERKVKIETARKNKKQKNLEDRLKNALNLSKYRRQKVRTKKS